MGALGVDRGFADRGPSRAWSLPSPRIEQAWLPLQRVLPEPRKPHSLSSEHRSPKSRRPRTGNANMVQVSTVILVHGAWANASAWAKVLPQLETAGVTAIAAQLPLTTLPDDAAALRRAIALSDGPVLLVGHSYGGAVITEAGMDPKVAGLVYVAAFAPGAGESAGGLGAGAPPTRILEVAIPDAGGFLKLTRDGVT